jgi:pyruvate kinase
MSKNSLATFDCGLDALEQELSAIRSEMIDAERRLHAQSGHIPEARRDSARNLLHYLAMRRRDLRALQGTLASRGLSSLGRS